MYCVLWFCPDIAMCTMYFGSVKISLCVLCTLVLSRYLYVYCVLWFCQGISMCTVYFGSVKISLCVLCTLVLSRYLYVYSVLCQDVPMYAVSLFCQDIFMCTKQKKLYYFLNCCFKNSKLLNVHSLNWLTT